AEAAVQTFGEPNLVVVDTAPVKDDAGPYLGLPETHITHERGLITKSEVRAVSLSKLQLKPQMVVWDLGAGSGAVAIEASVLVSGGRVCAVERDKNRAEQIRANCGKWGADGVSVFEADLPAGMEALPDPDRVFIGGGGKKLAAIIDCAARRLKADGILVVNAVLLESMQSAVDAMRATGLRTDITQIQISRSRPMPTGERMEALNPVWIVRGCLES
nr:precorrin-6Y C5,15-methyltransferase (decarboxylating) subunit CbiT [Desulfobacterales bacterium]